MIKIGKYTITKDDERNLKLTHTRKKGLVKGEDKGGTTEYFIGYYGYLDQCLNKIVNLEAMEAIKDESTVIDAIELKELITGVYGMIKDEYHIGAKDIDED